MKTFRLLALTFLLTIGFGLPSCFVCECPPYEGKYFRLQGVQLIDYRKTSSGFLEELKAGDSVQLENYQLHLGYQLEYYSQLNHSHSAPSFLLSSAYACNCPDYPRQSSKEQIRQLHLLSLNNFNEQYLAGDTINDLIQLKDLHNTLSVAEFSQRALSPEGVSLRLKEKPAAGEAFHLRLIMELDNGMLLETESEAVFIQ